MGRSQVLFNRSKGGRTGSIGGGRSNGRREGSGKGAQSQRSSTSPIPIHPAPPPPRPPPSSHASVASSSNYDDTANSLLLELPSTTSSYVESISLFQEDENCTTFLHSSSLHVGAMTDTLMSLNLSDRLKLPMQLARTIEDEDDIHPIYVREINNHDKTFLSPIDEQEVSTSDERVAVEVALSPKHSQKFQPNTSQSVTSSTEKQSQQYIQMHLPTQSSSPDKRFQQQQHSQLSPNNIHAQDSDNMQEIPTQSSGGSPGRKFQRFLETSLHTQSSGVGSPDRYNHANLNSPTSEVPASPDKYAHRSSPGKLSRTRSPDKYTQKTAQSTLISSPHRTASPDKYTDRIPILMASESSALDKQPSLDIHVNATESFPENLSHPILLTPTSDDPARQQKGEGFPLQRILPRDVVMESSSVNDQSRHDAILQSRSAQAAQADDSDIILQSRRFDKHQDQNAIVSAAAGKSNGKGYGPSWDATSATATSTTKIDSTNSDQTLRRNASSAHHHPGAYVVSSDDMLHEDHASSLAVAPTMNSRGGEHESNLAVASTFGSRGGDGDGDVSNVALLHGVTSLPHHVTDNGYSLSQTSSMSVAPSTMAVRNRDQLSTQAVHHGVNARNHTLSAMGTYASPAHEGSNSAVVHSAVAHDQATTFIASNHGHATALNENDSGLLQLSLNPDPDGSMAVVHASSPRAQYRGNLSVEVEIITRRPDMTSSEISLAGLRGREDSSNMAAMRSLADRDDEESEIGVARSSTPDDQESNAAVAIEHAAAHSKVSVMRESPDRAVKQNDYRLLTTRNLISDQNVVQGGTKWSMSWRKRAMQGLPMEESEQPWAHNNTNDLRAYWMMDSANIAAHGHKDRSTITTAPESSEAESEDVDRWLDTALASHTFEQNDAIPYSQDSNANNISGDDDDEALDAWLDSVIS